MKNMTNREFEYVAKRGVDVHSALSGVEWCLKQFLDDDKLDLNDAYANGRGVEELLSALWYARIALRQHQGCDDDDDFMRDIRRAPYALAESPIQKEDVQKALEAIQDAYPEAGNNGLTENLGGGKPMDCLEEDEFLEQVQTAATYVIRVVNNIGVRGLASQQSVTSYQLKHQAERWGRENGLAPYVCNMAAIVAMWLNPKVRIKVISRYPNPFSNLPNYYDEKSLT